MRSKMNSQTTFKSQINNIDITDKQAGNFKAQCDE